MPTVMSIASLTTAQAHVLAFFFASAYVGPLYVSKRTRLAFASKPLIANGRHRGKQQHERWRDDDDVIRARLVACTLSTTLCILTVVLVNWRTLGKEVSRFAFATCSFLDAMLGTPRRHESDRATPRTRNAFCMATSHTAPYNALAVQWSAIRHVPRWNPAFHVQLVI